MIDKILLAKQLAKITDKKFSDDENGFLEWAESILGNKIDQGCLTLEVETDKGAINIDMDDICYFRVNNIKPKFDIVVADMVSAKDLKREGALDDNTKLFNRFCRSLNKAIKKGQGSFELEIGGSSYGFDKKHISFEMKKEGNFYTFNVLDFITTKSYYNSSLNIRVNENMLRAVNQAAEKNNEDSSVLIRRAISKELNRKRK